MSSENLLDKLNERVTALQERSRHKQLGTLAIITKVNHFALKYIIKRARAKYIKDDCLNVSFLLEGGLGDFCIQFQWIKAFLDQHLLNQGDKRWGVIVIVSNVDFIKQMIGDYPFVDKICTYKEYISNYKCHLSFEFTNVADFTIQDHKAIRQYEPQLYEQLMQAEANYGPMRPMLTKSKAAHRHIFQYAEAKGYNRYDVLGSIGLCQFDRHTKPFFNVDHGRISETLNKFQLADVKFITVVSTIGSIPVPSSIPEDSKEFLEYKQQGTRLIPKDLAEQIIVKLKEELPEYKIVQLGGKEAIHFDHVDLDLIGKTSLNESIDLVYAADSMLVNDSGLMHIRYSMGKTATVVLWGPTPGKYVGYEANINIQGTCEPCLWLTMDWNTNCPRGYGCAQCMRSIKADTVVQAVKQSLGVA